MIKSSKPLTPSAPFWSAMSFSKGLFSPSIKRPCSAIFAMMSDAVRTWNILDNSSKMLASVVMPFFLRAGIKYCCTHSYGFLMNRSEPGT